MVVSSLKLMDAKRDSESEASEPTKYASLKKVVQTWMTNWPNQDSQTDVLRASGMYFVCPREFVLNYWSPQANRSFDYKAQLMMSTGTHLHSYLQNYVLGPMGILFGKWKHTGTSGIIKDGFHPDMLADMERAAKGLPLQWEYVEPTVWDEKHRISGHVDGVVCTNRLSFINKHARLFKTDPEEACKRLHDLVLGELALLEIKTTGSYVFKSIKSSDDIADYYKTQADIYQHLMDIPRTLFWYIERDSMQSKTLLYKHEVGRWNDAKRKAQIIWEAIRDRKLPDSMMACRMPTDPRAKKCVHKDECWTRMISEKPKVIKPEPFSNWIDKCIADQPDRKFLDLTDVEF